MNIVLIGYRGTGKSIVAQIVGERLGMVSIGMDAEIVRTAGMSIPEIVKKQGWPGFRDMESDVARALAVRDNIIIDTGGGVIERPENMAALGKNGRVIWLKASTETIVSRIQGDSERPSLTGKKSFTDEVAEVLDKRISKYQNAANNEIDTDPLTPEQVADRVCDIWKAE